MGDASSYNSMRTWTLKEALNTWDARHVEAHAKLSAAAMRALLRSNANPSLYVHGMRAMLKDCAAACAAVSAATVCARRACLAASSADASAAAAAAWACAGCLKG